MNMLESILVKAATPITCLFLSEPCGRAFPFLVLLGILLADEYQQPQLQNGLYANFSNLHKQQQLIVKHTVHYTILFCILAHSTHKCNGKLLYPAKL
jgi:hypothetical protein